MNKVKYAILATGLCLLTLIANAQHPNWYPEPRPVEFHDFPEIGLRIATDAEPAWQVVLEPNPSGKYATVVAKSPPNYFPMAELHFVSMPDVRMEDLTLENGRYPTSERETIEAVARIFKALGARYRIPSDVLIPANLKYEQRGDLSGYSLVSKGAIEGAADIQLFLMQGERPPQSLRRTDSPGEGLIFMAVVTQANTLPALEHVIRRSWIKTGYLLKASDN
ncbi:MAG: hypothetical protein IPM37_17060 [Hahellaceae bacterium]|nr:hypothetical protein [Hahellaceae bacterium]